MSETDQQADDFSTPLQNMMVEVHEVYEELLVVGFPEAVAARIMANMLSDIVFDRNPFSVEDDDDDDFDDDENEDNDAI